MRKSDILQSDSLIVDTKVSVFESLHNWFCWFSNYHSPMMYDMCHVKTLMKARYNFK
jgi:hypothetical protein